MSRAAKPAPEPFMRQPPAQGRKAPAGQAKKAEAPAASFAARPAPFRGAEARMPREQTGSPGFAMKLTLAMLLVLTLALSLGGAMLLAGNFTDSLNEAGQQAEAQHLLQCYALESDLLDVAARGETVTDSHLARYGSTLADYTGGRMAAIFCMQADASGAPEPGGGTDAKPEGFVAPADGDSAASANAESGGAAASADGAPTPPDSETALRQVYSSFP